MWICYKSKEKKPNSYFFLSARGKKDNWKKWKASSMKYLWIVGNSFLDIKLCCKVTRYVMCPIFSASLGVLEGYRIEYTLSDHSLRHRKPESYNIPALTTLIYILKICSLLNQKNNLLAETQCNSKKIRARLNPEQF